MLTLRVMLLKLRGLGASFLKDLYPPFVSNYLKERLERSRETFKLEQALRDYGFSVRQIAQLHNDANRISRRCFVRFLDAYAALATYAIQEKLNEGLETEDDYADHATDRDEIRVDFRSKIN